MNEYSISSNLELLSKKIAFKLNDSMSMNFSINFKKDSKRLSFVKINDQTP